jgi:ribosomal protein L31E
MAKRVRRDFIGISLKKVKKNGQEKKQANRALRALRAFGLLS